MHSPLRNRLRARPRLPEAPTTYQPGGGIGLDVGPALHDAQVLELLRQLGISKKP